jgi:hypothetical protein
MSRYYSHVTPTWPDEAIEQLRALGAAGKRIYEAAAMMGKTQRAVQAKAFRLGIQMGGQPARFRRQNVVRPLRVVRQIGRNWFAPLPPSVPYVRCLEKYKTDKFIMRRVESHE